MRRMGAGASARADLQGTPPATHATTRASATEDIGRRGAIRPAAPALLGRTLIEARRPSRDRSARPIRRRCAPWSSPPRRGRRLRAARGSGPPRSVRPRGSSSTTSVKGRGVASAGQSASLSRVQAPPAPRCPSGTATATCDSPSHAARSASASPGRTGARPSQIAVEPPRCTMSCTDGVPLTPR